MTLTVYTARVQDHKRLKAEGYHYIDTTVKSGEKIFAPTWEMVMGIKKGHISETEYTRQYNHIMSESVRLYTDRWDALFEKDHVVILCYCSHGIFCHRHLLAKMIQRYFKLRHDKEVVISDALEKIV